MNRRAWERVADQYDARERVIVGALFGDFMASLPDGGRVLDMGSGTRLPYAGALVEGGFRRGVHVTEEFGEEHQVEFLFRKPRAPGL
jgi:hypothetical protein